MPSSFNFSEQYQKLSNTDLLYIIENPGKYQDHAIEAANTEWEKRSLSDAEKEEARKEILNREQVKEQKKDRIQSIRHKAQYSIGSLAETINPIQTTKRSADRIINFIVLIFSFFYLYRLVNNYEDLIFYLREFQQFAYEMPVILLEYIVLPVGIFAFFKRKIAGWIIIAIYLSFSMVSLSWFLYEILTWEAPAFEFLDAEFRPSPVPSLVQLLFAAGMLYAICRIEIREKFSVDQIIMMATLIITTLLSVLNIYLILQLV
jgi:hypothetical protein